MNLMEKRVALSWSGGKDSCLALDVLTNKGINVVCLVTTVPKELGRTFGHGEKLDMVKLQSEALRIPLEFVSCTFDDYTVSYQNTLAALKTKYQIDGIAFGDLYLEGHREWGEELASQVSIDSLYPLWTIQENSFQALQTFVDSGYKATVIKVREDILDESWLGRELDGRFLKDVRNIKMCPLGESGEYHTFVYDGPLFRSRIILEDPIIIELESTKKLEFHHFRLQSKE